MTLAPGLPEPDRRRLAGALAIAACTSGAPDGERLAAVAAAERLLARHGLKLPDLARPMTAARPEPGQWDWRDTNGDGLPPAREMVAALADCAANLSAWEQDFIGSLLSRRRPLSAKQSDVVTRLYRRHVLRGWA